MLEAGKLTDDPLHQYCCSCLIIQVANIGLNCFIAAWNSHRIPGVLAYSYLQFACVYCNLWPLHYCACASFCTHIGHRKGPSRGTPNDLHHQDDRARNIELALLSAPLSAVTSYESGGGSVHLCVNPFSISTTWNGSCGQFSILSELENSKTGNFQLALNRTRTCVDENECWSRIIFWKAAWILWFWKAAVQGGGTSWELSPVLRPLPAPAPLCSVQPVYLYPSLQASQVCGCLRRTCLSCTLRSEGSDSPSWRQCSSTVNGEWPWSVRGTCVGSMFICTLLLESFWSCAGG